VATHIIWNLAITVPQRRVAAIHSMCSSSTGTKSAIGLSDAESVDESFFLHPDSKGLTPPSRRSSSCSRFSNRGACFGHLARACSSRMVTLLQFNHLEFLQEEQQSDWGWRLETGTTSKDNDHADNVPRQEMRAGVLQLQSLKFGLSVSR